ncbi:hypothetical protein NLG97_g11335 [Lecanicillium saksenae]|uniref:Uncharacterized protein n=1 Tax=Lecanicillium saksenae TaxID=468837 RepID=A0ACC1QAN6_9HYPO|nr:hypothetical protein NLG97_g11335 [Lecanicillium saksenae]
MQKHAGYGQAGVYEVRNLEVDDGNLILDALLDRSSLEIFSREGAMMSATIFPRYKESTNIAIQADGGQVTLQSFTLTQLGSAWC